MIKKTVLVILILVIVNLLSFSKVVATFPDLARPNKFIVDKDKIYICENQNISIYSINGYKFLRKFGRKGEGPMEFIGRLNLSGKKDFLIVQGHGKLSYWTKKGGFIREVKVNFHFHGNIAQLGTDMYVLNRYEPGIEKNHTNYNAIVLYDSNFKEIFTIDKKKEGKRGGYIKLFTNSYLYRTSRTKKMIYVIGHNGKQINVYNEKGKKLFFIKAPSEKVEITEKDKNAAISYYNFVRRNYHTEMPRSKFRFEKYKPAIKDFYEFDNLLYVETWNRTNGKTQFYIFDQNGKMIKKVFLPLAMKNFKNDYPYYVDGGKLYQLVENEDNEIWELNVTDIGL